MKYQFDPSNADCLVFTYREGLLSAVAHDLQLRMTRFQVQMDSHQYWIRGIFEPGSLRVMGACNGGRVTPGILSPKDIREIEDNIAKDVLEPKLYPEIRFESSKVVAQGDAFHVKGELFMHGCCKELNFPVRQEGNRLLAEVWLHQPDFGIRPFSKMFGALRIKPAVLVRIWISVPQK